MCFKNLPVVFDEAGKAHLRGGAAGPAGAAHRTAPAEGMEMASGVPPPPMGTIVRNLGQAAEFLYDHPLHLFLLAGPDYSEPVVKATNPELWTRGGAAPTLHGAVPGL